MPPDALDVNVHPTKAEVRFREQSLVHEVVRRALMDALGQGGVPQLQLRPEMAERIARGADASRASSAAASFRAAGCRGAGSTPCAAIRRRRGARREAAEQSEPAGRDGCRSAAAAQIDIRPMIPLGQFRDTFIIAVDDEGVAIIDQHVAHERVLFERVMERLAAGPLESQRLLVPLLIDLRAGRARGAGRPRRRARSTGLRDRELRRRARSRSRPCRRCSGPRTARRRCWRSPQDLEGLDRGAHVQEALQRIAATTACHAAVKANYPLTYEKMAHILEELRATAYSTICPHGRPVMLRLTRREIEKNFERI